MINDIHSTKQFIPRLIYSKRRSNLRPAIARVNQTSLQLTPTIATSTLSRTGPKSAKRSSGLISSDNFDDKSNAITSLIRTDFSSSSSHSAPAIASCTSANCTPAPVNTISSAASGNHAATNSTTVPTNIASVNNNLCSISPNATPANTPAAASIPAPAAANPSPAEKLSSKILNYFPEYSPQIALALVERVLLNFAPANGAAPANTTANSNHAQPNTTPANTSPSIPAPVNSTPSPAAMLSSQILNYSREYSPKIVVDLLDRVRLNFWAYGFSPSNISCSRSNHARLPIALQIALSKSPGSEPDFSRVRPSESHWKECSSYVSTKELPAFTFHRYF